MGCHSVGLTSRILPAEEWHLLRGLGPCAVSRPDDATRGAVLVEEIHGQIVGCAVVFKTLDDRAHIDAVWIHHAFRTGRIALRLWRRIQTYLLTLGASRVYVYPASKAMTRFVQRQTWLVPQGVYIMEAAHAR